MLRMVSLAEVTVFLCPGLGSLFATLRQCQTHAASVHLTFHSWPCNPQVCSHNVRRFRFALPEKKMVIGLPIGSHITIAAKDTDGKDVMRPYTPVTDDNQKGYVDFIIKAGSCTFEESACSHPFRRLTLPGQLLCTAVLTSAEVKD